MEQDLGFVTGRRARGVLAALALVAAAPAVAHAAPTYKATSTLPLGARTPSLALEVDPLTHTLYTIGSQEIVPFVGGKAGTPLPGQVGSHFANYSSGGSVDPTDGTFNAVYGGGGIEGDPLVSQLRQFRGGALTADLPVGSLARATAVDPSTHTTYVLSAGTGGFIQGSKDQLDIVRGGVVVKNVPLPFSTWFGATGTSASAIAVDPSTHVLYVFDQDKGAIAVLDANGAVTGSIPLGGDLGSIAIDPATHTLYVTRPGADAVSVIRGGAVVGTIAVGDAPSGVEWDAATKTLFVLNTGDETVSQVTGGAQVATTAAGVEQPTGFALDTADHTVYVSGSAPSRTDTFSQVATVSVLTADERPGVVAVGPATFAKPDAPIYVVFDRPMDREAAGAAISLGRYDADSDTYPLPSAPSRVEASVAWLGDRVAVVLPADRLAPATRYELRVGTGAKDATGKALPVPVVRSFSVASSYVERVSPGDGAGGVYPNAPIVEVFSKEVPENQRTAQELGFSLTKRGSTAKVPGSFLWIYGGRVLVFTPAQDLETGARYDILQRRQESYFLDLDSKSSFSVVDRPVVELVTPAKNATSVPKDAAVVAVFSQPIDPASVGQVTFQRSFGFQQAVPVTRAWYGPRVLVLKPTAPLAANAQYVVRIPGATDTAGRTMDGPVTWKFTTGPSFADTSAVPFGALKTSALLRGQAAPLSVADRALTRRIAAAG